MADRQLSPPEAPAATREADALRNLLIESVRDYAIFVLDPAGFIQTWNPGAQRLKGYTESEIIGQHFSIFYPPEDILTGKPAHELVIAEQEGRVEDEGWRLRKDGSRFWANVVITALRDPSGRLLGFGKVTRDLSDRRAVEEALRSSEERFRLLVQNVRDYLIVMLDASGRIVSWNEGAHRITQWSEQEVVGQHFSIFYPAEERHTEKPALELKTAAERGGFAEETWRIRKDGSRFWAGVNVSPLHDSEGRLIGYAKVTRDLTERRAAEERAIADAHRLGEAESLSRAKSEFLAALSHELRTPLNAIGGYADLLSMGVRGQMNEAQLEDLRRIKHSQQHLLSIINDLLNFSRVEAGQVNYDLGPVVIADTLDSVRSMIEPVAAKKTITLDWPKRKPEVVAWADSLKVEQILINLLSNAVKFTSRRGCVAIEYSGGKDAVTIIVRDNGIGIAAERLHEIFEPFVQVGRSLTTPQEGTGLGLAISHDLAVAMGGDLTVTSTLGQGSEFTLTLPSRAAEGS
jgi:PAS domain S-box-containing protein